MRLVGGDGAQGDFAEYFVFRLAFRFGGGGAPSEQGAHQFALLFGAIVQAVGKRAAEGEDVVAVLADAHRPQPVDGG